LLLGFSAVNTGNNLLFLVVSALLAFMSITGLAGMLNLQKIYPELLSPIEVFAGTPAPFRLRLNNSKGYLPSFLIRVETASGDNYTIPVINCNCTVEEFSSRLPFRIVGGQLLALLPLVQTTQSTSLLDTGSSI